MSAAEVEVTYHAVCLHCAHVEPRPEIEPRPAHGCENCGRRDYRVFDHLDEALEHSEAILSERQAKQGFE